MLSISVRDETTDATVQCGMALDFGLIELLGCCRRDGQL